MHTHHEPYQQRTSRALLNEGHALPINVLDASRARAGRLWAQFNTKPACKTGKVSAGYGTDRRDGAGLPAGGIGGGKHRAELYEVRGGRGRAAVLLARACCPPSLPEVGDPRGGADPGPGVEHHVGGAPDQIRQLTHLPLHLLRWVKDLSRRETTRGMERHSHGPCAPPGRQRPSTPQIRGENSRQEALVAFFNDKYTQLGRDSPLSAVPTEVKGFKPAGRWALADGVLGPCCFLEQAPNFISVGCFSSPASWGPGLGTGPCTTPSPPQNPSQNPSTAGG